MTGELSLRVYYEDTDAGGVLYHATIVRYLDRGRTEWLSALGYSLSGLVREHQRVFAVHSLSVRYLLPGRLDDRLTVRTGLSAHSRVALDFAQSVWRDEECLAEANVKVACVDTRRWAPGALPSDLQEKLKQHG